MLFAPDDSMYDKYIYTVKCLLVIGTIYGKIAGLKATADSKAIT